MKKRFQNDSNSLNTAFYNELLYIIGLKEKETTVNGSTKKIITRLESNERNRASILENAITILSTEDLIDNVEERSSYGKNTEEQLIGIALALTIHWVNRILFLKLLEAQLIKYHKGKTCYAFLNPSVITDYDELNKLFFQVLANRVANRDDSISTKYGKIPYLNSSLFEVSPLEKQTIRISSLDNSELPLYPSTVLKDGSKPRYKQLPTLRYLLEFLDAYDFASEGSEEIQQQAKTLISASVLGLIFEKINGHKDGSVFTPGNITMFMSREAIQQTVVRRFNEDMGWNCNDYDALRNKEIDDITKANAIIDSLRICDPAVGSGHFLVSVLNEIIRIKYDLGILVDNNGKRIKKRDYSIDIENDELLVSDEDGNPFSYTPGNIESQRIQETLFNEKRKIIENCLYGVDINPNAVNICRLRLWIELLKNAYYTKESDFTELETLPNIDINIKVGNSLLHRFDLNQDISEILRKNDISLDEYRQAVNNYKHTHSKEEKKKLDEIIHHIKGNLCKQIGLNNPKIRKKKEKEAELNELLAPQLDLNIEISKKAKDQRDKNIKKLRVEIEKLQKEINEIRDNKIFENAFEWRIEFPEVLDENGKFIGFDCVIGNPPYIQLQKMGADKDALKKMNYETYDGSGDIYCLFYERGWQLLKKNGHLCYITSNKWMRAGYGEKTREFFAKNTNPMLLIDFAGVKIFESATVDTNILLFSKTSNQHKTICAVTNKQNKDSVKNMSDFVQQQNCICDFATSDSWVILSPIEQSIKRKIEAVGTPLKDWDIQINYGIKTGFNDAFIISTEKRNEILANCKDANERQRTAELIRPILCGRDIKRYGYVDNGLFLINTHNGVRGRIPRIKIEDYPAVKAHLDQYWDRIATRADKGDTPYNLRNCAYLEDFSRPKIIWAETMRIHKHSVERFPRFSYDERGLKTDKTCFFAVGEKLEWIVCFINSYIGQYLCSKYVSILDNGGYLMQKIYIEQISIPPIHDDVYELCKSQIIKPQNAIEDEIDASFFRLYGLTDEEVSYLISKAKNNFAQ